MAIHNVSGGMTGGINSLRYVEKGVTVNIPIGYVVEGRKTVLVYRESTGAYTPTGNPAYLYNRGTLSDILGGFENTGSSQLTITQESDHLAICIPAGVTLSEVTSEHLMDFSEYSTLYLEYEYVNGRTGETLTSAGDVYYMKAVDEEGNGGNVLLTVANTSASMGNLDASQRIQFTPGFGTAVMSADYDVIFKIYSIRVEQ